MQSPGALPHGPGLVADDIQFCLSVGWLLVGDHDRAPPRDGLSPLRGWGACSACHPGADAPGYRLSPRWGCGSWAPCHPSSRGGACFQSHRDGRMWPRAYALGEAIGARQSPGGAIGIRPSIFLSPLGGWFASRDCRPGADAPGYRLSPLRGCAWLGGLHLTASCLSSLRRLTFRWGFAPDPTAAAPPTAMLARLTSATSSTTARNSLGSAPLRSIVFRPTWKTPLLLELALLA